MKTTIMLASVLVLAISLMNGCSKDQSSKAIEDEVKQALPIGTPMEKVDSYLTSHKVEHSLYKKENRIYAIVRNVQTQSNGVSGNLSVIFSFDTNNSLTNVQSKVEYTGP